MLEDESVSVVITASKESSESLSDSDTNVGFHPGPISPRVPHSPSSIVSHSPSHATHHAHSATTTSSNTRKSSKIFTVYTVRVRNRITDAKCVVKRRYSDFFRLRKKLIEVMSWRHCSACDQFVHQIAGYPFPRRRFLRSTASAVVTERMDSLGLFLRHLLSCMLDGTFDVCPQARDYLEYYLLKIFLHVKDESALFPTRYAPNGRRTPRALLQSMEAQRYHDQQLKAASLRSTPLGTQSHGISGATTPSKGSSGFVDGSLASPMVSSTRSEEAIGTNTCPLCRQKWTHCYCSEDQDRIYPVNAVIADTQREIAGMQIGTEQVVTRRRGSSQPMRLSHLALDNANQSLSRAIASGERRSEEIAVSEAGRCSRCENKWHGCYCGQ